MLVAAAKSPQASTTARAGGRRAREHSVDEDDAQEGSEVDLADERAEGEEGRARFFIPRQRKIFVEVDKNAWNRDDELDISSQNV